MQNSEAKQRDEKAAPLVRPATPPRPPRPPDLEVPAKEAFLEDAKGEPKRKLITDHIETINVLRNEKRFTFRAIAEWLTKRGIEADHSAVYRAYLAAIPEENRDPREPWDDEVDVPE